jgi:hypothetical protein
MATYVKFQPFVEYLAEKSFDLQNDTLKVMLTNTTPSAAWGTKSQATDISAGNGYTAGGTQATVSSSAQTSGTYKLVLADVTFTASGGSIGPFEWAILYDDTATSKQLIAYWDYGSAVTLASGESFTWDADPSTGVLTIA